MPETGAGYNYQKKKNAKEVINFAGVQIAPSNVKVKNPAFDVTPKRTYNGMPRPKKE